MWSHMLREQFHVTVVALGTCARDGILPDRGQPAQVVEKKAVPLQSEAVGNERQLSELLRRV